MGGGEPLLPFPREPPGPRGEGGAGGAAASRAAPGGFVNKFIKKIPKTAKFWGVVLKGGAGLVIDSGDRGEWAWLVYMGVVIGTWRGC